MSLPAETTNIVLLAAVVLLMIWNLSLTLVLRRLAANRLKLSTWVRSGPDVEEVFAKALGELKDVNERTGRLEQIAKRHRDILGRTVKHVGLVRYDAFDDIGGKMSFSAALLDEAGSGVIVTSINGRQDGRVYAKPIQAKQSSYQLSSEEEQAIASAFGPGAVEVDA